MFIYASAPSQSALRQEGNVYRCQRRAGSPSVRRAMFIDASAEPSALRQEGNVYRRQRRAGSPSVRRAMFIDASAGQCL